MHTAFRLLFTLSSTDYRINRPADGTQISLYTVHHEICMSFDSNRNSSIVVGAAVK